MNELESSVESASENCPAIGRKWWLLAIAWALLSWSSQPPLGWWPLCTVAVAPLLLAATTRQITKKRFAVLFLAGAIYWAVTLQGLRHANPLIYPCWIVLSAYLGIYPVLFVLVLNRLLRRGAAMLWAAPLAWVAMECIRNYLLTGISAAMLGHALAEVPSMIQIADLGGTYAVSLVVVAANVLLLNAWTYAAQRTTTGEAPAEPDLSPRSFPLVTGIVVILLWSATYLYGRYRLGQPTDRSNTKIALIGRNEPVEYAQDPSRELELFGAYVNQSVRAIDSCDETIDAVVWPESMLTGTMPWTIGEGGPGMTQASGYSIDEQRAMIAEYQKRFKFRAASVQSMLAQNNGPDQKTPHLIGGCGVVDYGETIRVYSGIVHLDEHASVANWYGKTHLVMFGEYIPLIKQVPIVRSWVPQNVGLTQGDRPQRFRVGDLTLCPNICIETAVERVPINHLRTLRTTSKQGLPDAIVTVTNDAWFDDSSVVQHHKRCAQFVAVACRRPVLSAANNGPTVWIDSCGQIVDEIPQGGAGSVVAQPERDGRTSLVMWIGDWPARICALLFLVVLVKRPKDLTPARNE